MKNWQEIRKEIEGVAVRRKEGKVLKNEADFFSGAMAAIHALTGEAPNTYWTISIMSGRSIIKEAMKEVEHANA